MNTKPRLGKGLDALLGDLGTTDNHHITPKSQQVAISLIQLNPYQPRKSFDEDELKQLAASIQTHGVLTPVLVRPVGDKYQLIAGERRLRAAQRAGLTHIPVHIREMDEQQVVEAALVENIQRSDLNPIEKAQGFKDYLEKFKMTQDHLATRLGLDRTTISNLLNLLNLCPPVQEFVRVGQLSLGHAKVLKAITDTERQTALAREVIAKNLSVHALEVVAKIQKEEAREPKARSSAIEKTRHVQSIEDDLRKRLAIRVAIRLKARDKGQIVLSFDSNDDFERIVDLLRK